MNTMSCRPACNVVPTPQNSLWPSYVEGISETAGALNSSGGVSYVQICLATTEVTELLDYTSAVSPDPSAGSDAKGRLAAQVAAYQALADDWDGYGGVAASLDAVADAVAFLTKLSAGLPLPKPMIAGSGVIGLYWEANDRYASIDFDGSGGYCYIADRPGDEHGEDWVPLSQGLTQRLIEVIAETAEQL